MKQIISLLIITLLVPSLNIFSQNDKHKISYEISIKSETESNDNSIFINNLDFVKLEKFYLKCLENSLKNQIKVDEMIKEYRYETLSFEKLDDTPYLKKSGDTILYKWYKNSYNPTLLDNKFYSVYTQVELDLETGMEKIDQDGNLIYVDQVNLEDIHQSANKIHFNEKWSINNEGKLIKTTEGIKFSSIDHSREWYLHTPEALINNEKPTDLVFLKNVCYDVLFNKNPMEEDSDFPYLNYLSFEAKKNLINPIFSDVVSGKSEIYHPNAFDENGNFKVISKENVKEYISETYQIEDYSYSEGGWGDYNYDADGNIKMTDYTEFYQNKDIIGLHFVEDWYLDTKTMSFVKEVKYYAPIVNAINHYSGESIGYKLLFLIKN